MNALGRRTRRREASWVGHVSHLKGFSRRLDHIRLGFDDGRIVRLFDGRERHSLGGQVVCPCVAREVELPHSVSPCQYVDEHSAALFLHASLCLLVVDTTREYTTTNSLATPTTTATPTTNSLSSCCRPLPRLSGDFILFFESFDPFLGYVRHIFDALHQVFPQLGLLGATPSTRTLLCDNRETRR